MGDMSLSQAIHDVRAMRDMRRLSELANISDMLSGRWNWALQGPRSMQQMRSGAPMFRMVGRQPERSGGRIGWILLGVGLGAAAMFALDPRTGKRRRALARDKMVRLGNSVDEMVSEQLPRKVDYLSGVARGARYRATHVAQRNGEALPDEDQFITDRVMSTVFRDPALPKGDINVNTVDQVVYLRGHVEDGRLVKEIEDRVRKVEGVREVINVINRPEVDPSDIRADDARRAERG